jgi:hypothetical protein
LVFFAGVALTGIGSLWYHVRPDNSRLLWDLLPMACCFMAILSTVIMERISASAGLSLFVPLLGLGVASVLYWLYTEGRGAGDYRFYLFVQFVPPVLAAILVALFPARYTGAGYLAAAFFSFVLAKVFEHFDAQIYRFAGVSGHSLKHITAAAACFWILPMVQRRHPSGTLNAEDARLRSVEYEKQSA